MASVAVIYSMDTRANVCVIVKLAVCPRITYGFRPSLKDPNTSTSLADGILLLLVVREKAGPLTVMQEAWLSQVDLDATLDLESVCDVLFVK